MQKELLINKCRDEFSLAFANFFGRLLLLTVGPAFVGGLTGQKSGVPVDSGWWVLAGLVVAGLLIRQQWPVAALALVLIGLLQAVLVGGAIAGAVRQLGAAVVAFASRSEVVLPPWTVRELRDVLRVIESTAAMGWRKPGDRER